MTDKTIPRIVQGILASAVALLSGCQGGVLDPRGQVGADEKNLILIATGLMLVVVIPVIVMTLVFAWRYRASNNEAEYDPKWSHSGKIELVVWTIPIIIVVILGTITWATTHSLDPYKPLEQGGEPLQVEVVSLNWKWLFIYPEQNIATVNELVIPAHRQVAFKLTSESVMNSFFIPQLGSQIYTMAAMATRLHLIADEPGSYDGFSANYSGAGFSEMKFRTIATADEQSFDDWVHKVKSSGAALSSAVYQQLTEPSEADPVTYYAAVKPGLFDDIVMKYMRHHGHTPLTGQGDMPSVPALPAEEMHDMTAHENTESTHGSEE